MKKSILVLLIILLIIIIGVSIYLLFLSNPKDNDKPEPPTYSNGEPTNGENGYQTNGDDDLGIELQDNYLFTTKNTPNNFLHMTIEMKRVNKSHYDFELKDVLIIPNKEYFELMSNLGLLLIMYVPFSTPVIFNRDISEAQFNAFKEFQENIKDNFVIYDFNNLSEIAINDINSFEEYYQKLKQFFILQIALYDFPNSEDVQDVFTKMFDLGIEMRNITVFTEFLYEDLNSGEFEAYPFGEFKYFGDEKKFYNRFCDRNNDCITVYDKEWIYLDEFTIIYEQFFATMFDEIDLLITYPITETKKIIDNCAEEDWDLLSIKACYSANDTVVIKNNSIFLFDGFIIDIECTTGENIISEEFTNTNQILDPGQSKLFNSQVNINSGDTVTIYSKECPLITTSIVCG